MTAGSRCETHPVTWFRDLKDSTSMDLRLGPVSFSPFCAAYSGSALAHVRRDWLGSGQPAIQHLGGIGEGRPQGRVHRTYILAHTTAASDTTTGLTAKR